MNTLRTHMVSSIALALTLLLASVVQADSAAQPAAAVTILAPATDEPVYRIASETFADLWEKVTGRRPGVFRVESGKSELPAGDLILIGSDAVHPVLHELIYAGTLESLDLVYGADNYRILTLERDGRHLVIVAGGSGRSTLYAVYDFFRRQAGAEYFWDGDVLPHHDSIDLAGLDIREQPHFDYRGLRYFAHRGLYRFQAEHWDLEDWKHEIDWLLKKRFNLFMLRTGIDDLFQRAFPDVPYPPTDAQDPDAKSRSYDDRTSLWALKYRGELRKAVLQYARDRGLLHPEDTGTITHWYSHTPSAFYRTRPDFPVIRDQKSGYELRTQAIWDIEAPAAWEAYWKLTETHIRDFGEPRLFHTIGMAERTFGKSARDNLQRKLYVYRQTLQTLRKHYPDAPLLLAGWDFLFWKSEDVQRLLQEFDRRQTIVLDYIADHGGRVSYRDWNLLGKFPWIYGIFHSFARNSDIHGDYALLAQRLGDAASDPQCRGLVTWPEISHHDTFLLEYLGDNSWQPQRLELPQATARYCQTRYPCELAVAMQPLWTAFFPLSQSVNWGAGGDIELLEPQFRMLGTGAAALTPKRLAELETDYQRMLPGLRQSPEVLQGLAGLTERWYDDPLWRRDAIDIARTTASRALRVSLALGAMRMEAWRQQKAEGEPVRRLAELSQRVLGSLSNVLAASDEFSMEASLRRLTQAQELNGVQPTINPHAEQTLKGNAENDYCRGHHYELVEYVNRRELAAYWAWVVKRIESQDRSDWRRPAEFAAQEREIVDRFYARPLAEMAPTQPRDAQRLAAILLELETVVQALLEETKN